MVALQEILDLAVQVAPTQKETDARNAAFERVQAACQAADMCALIPLASSNKSSCDVHGNALWPALRAC